MTDGGSLSRTAVMGAALGLSLLASRTSQAQAPKLLVYLHVSLKQRAFQGLLQSALPGVDVTAVGRISDFDRAMSDSPDAVLTLPLVLSAKNMRVQLQGQRSGSGEEKYALVAADAAPDPARVKAVGALDVLGRDGTNLFVNQHARRVGQGRARDQGRRSAAALADAARRRDPDSAAFAVGRQIGEPHQPRTARAAQANRPASRCLARLGRPAHQRRDRQAPARACRRPWGSTHGTESTRVHAGPARWLRAAARLRPRPGLAHYALLRRNRSQQERERQGNDSGVHAGDAANHGGLVGSARRARQELQPGRAQGRGPCCARR